MAVLAAIEAGETYGYALVERLRAAGFDDLADASVYGTLKRLQTSGSLAVRWEASSSGPARKYYRLTAGGDRELLALRREWRVLASAIEQLGGRP